jgi:hypothetical protein
MTMTTIAKISGRMKLGLGWSNTPARNRPEIEHDNEPSNFGTIRQLQDCLVTLKRQHGDSWFAWSFYVRDGMRWVRLGLGKSEYMLAEWHSSRDTGKAFFAEVQLWPHHEAIAEQMEL